MASQETTAKLQEATNLNRLNSAHIFAVAATALAVTVLPWRYLLSGAPVLTASILIGAANGIRILPFINLWVLLGFINISYSIAATSWLLYYAFAIGCYPTVLISCLFQFNAVADFTRNNLRRVLQILDFTEDKIAFFDLPALEIDTPDVKGGLMVIRGLTISFSTLTVIAHGVEVGIKLSDDMELALVTDEVRIEFFRKIHVSDCYGNLKGGLFEMTFGELAPDTTDANGQPVMFETDTPMLQAVGKALDRVESGSVHRKSVDMGQGSPGFSRVPTIPNNSDVTPLSISRASTLRSVESVDTLVGDSTPSSRSRTSTMKSVFGPAPPPLPERQLPPTVFGPQPPSLPERQLPAINIPEQQGQQFSQNPPPPLPSRAQAVPMVDHMTAGAPPKDDQSPIDAVKSAKTLTPSNEGAAKKYREAIRNIAETSPINQGKTELETRHFGERYLGSTRIIGDTFDPNDKHALRSATCSWLQDQSSIAHPSTRSIKVTTIQAMTPPHVSRFLHRLPLLFRLMMCPLTYFHPVEIDSITTGASGAWVESMLQEHVFKGYPEQDAELRRLWARVSAWLTDATFVFQLGHLNGHAQTPVNTEHDIETYLDIDDIMAYRTIPNAKATELKQVVRLGGADARINVPTFLMPHHEHLLPPIPSSADRRAGEAAVRDADGHPATVLAEHELGKLERDEAAGKLSVHARLPVVVDQELLNFVAALVKATKLIEMDKSGLTSPKSTPVDADSDTTSLDERLDENQSLSRESTQSQPSGHGRFKSLHMGYLKDIKGVTKDFTGMTKDFTKSVSHDIRHSIKRTTVDAVVNDKWIAKLVGKVAKQLENALGDVGYSGELPIPLGPYRDKAETPSKILP